MTGPRVLVLGGRTAIALQLCRALHRAGCVVVAADSLATSVTRASRAVTSFVRLPRPGADLPAFIDAVEDVVTTHGITQVIPTGEERLWLAFAAAHGRALSLPPIGQMPIGVLAALHDKLDFQGLVAAAGLAPTTTLPATREAIATLLGVHERVVVKPRAWRFGRGVVIVDRARAPADWPVSVDAVVQPFCAGEERCGFVLAAHGRVVAAVVYLPRWRFPLGPSFGMEPVDDPALVAAMTRLVAAHRLHGAFGVDVVVGADGHLAFLECNPRFTSGVHLIDDAALCAALLPDLSSSSSLMPSSPSSLPPRPRMVAPAMLLFGPGQAGPLWRDFWRSDDVVWDRRDPLPSLAFIGNIFELSWLAHREGIPARYATSHQLGWDPEQAARSLRAAGDAPLAPPPGAANMRP